MKKIFLWGKYDVFVVNGVKYHKNAGDYLVITIKSSTNFKTQRLIMVDSITYVKNYQQGDTIKGMEFYFKKEQADFLGIVSGDESIDTMQEFNRRKLFCEENKAELVVVKTYVENDLTSIRPYNIYEPISKLESNKV